MLSDEEREALEILNNTEWDGFMITIKNLIEKQSKEIEELKVNNKKLQDKAKELIYEKQQLTSALLDSTPNDKIKAKIDEVCESTIEESNVDILYSLLEKE